MECCELIRSPNRFCNSHGLNQLSTDSYKMHGQQVDIWSSFRARLPPTNLHKTTTFRWNIRLKVYWKVGSIKSCISHHPRKIHKNHRGSPALKTHLSCRGQKGRCPKTAVFWNFRSFRYAGRESGANPKGALPFQSRLLPLDIWVDICWINWCF